MKVAVKNYKKYKSVKSYNNTYFKKSSKEKKKSMFNNYNTHDVRQDSFKLKNPSNVFTEQKKLQEDIVEVESKNKLELESIIRQSRMLITEKEVKKEVENFKFWDFLKFNFFGVKQDEINKKENTVVRFLSRVNKNLEISSVLNSIFQEEIRSHFSLKNQKN